MWRVDELNGGKWSLTQEDSSGGHTGSPHMLLTKINTRGAGAPIGDDDFCAEFVGLKVDAALAKCRALRGIHPQVGMLLLRKCCVLALSYLSQVVPPSLTAQHFARFDEELAAFVHELLTLPGRPHGLLCVEERMSVFRQRLRLPTRFNGAGLLGVDGVGPAAFVGSVIACCEVDTVLADNITGLERFAAPAIRMLQARLAPLGNERVNATLRLPLGVPVDLFSPARYVEQDSKTNRAPKMQQVWGKEVHAAAARRLGPLEAALGDCDFVASQARQTSGANPQPSAVQSLQPLHSGAVRGVVPVAVPRAAARAPRQRWRGRR